MVKRENISRTIRITIGIMAALGFAIKPYFYVFALAPLAYAWWQERSLKNLLYGVENIINAGWALSYIAIVFICFD